MPLLLRQGLLNNVWGSAAGLTTYLSHPLVSIGPRGPLPWLHLFPGTGILPAFKSFHLQVVRTCVILIFFPLLMIPIKKSTKNYLTVQSRQPKKNLFTISGLKGIEKSHFIISCRAKQNPTFLALASHYSIPNIILN